MKYISAVTRNLDAYRAGVELAENLLPAKPDTVILFCTIYYFPLLKDIVDGLRDILGQSLLVCGGTGDGVYAEEGVFNHGITALGIASKEGVRWEAVLVRGVQSDSAHAVKQAAILVKQKLGVPVSLAFVMADGCKADGSCLVDGLREALDAPCFGALAADDRKFEHSGVFVGDEAAEDAVIVLAASGNVPFRLNASSGWSPVGESGYVTKADGNVVKEINHVPASMFLKEQMGKGLGAMDLGVVPLAEYVSNKDQFVLRTPSNVDQKSGDVKLFGRVHQGAMVRICRASMEDIVGAVEKGLEGLVEDGFIPGAVVVVSCAGRKWLLTSGGKEEVEKVLARFGNIPLIGMPSFGEIGPFRLADGGYSPVMFHNVTFVVCILGK
jgi:hypothetical protein